MIRFRAGKRVREASKRTEYRTEIDSVRLSFSDTSLAPFSVDRFIGMSDSSPVVDLPEEAFLSTAQVVGCPGFVNSMTVSVKSPTASFSDVSFELYRAKRPKGQVKMERLATISISGEVTSSHCAFYETVSFERTVLAEGDLVSVLVISGGVEFYSSVFLC